MSEGTSDPIITKANQAKLFAELLLPEIRVPSKEDKNEARE